MAPPSRGDLTGAAGTGVHLLVAPPVPTTVATYSQLVSDCKNCIASH